MNLKTILLAYVASLFFQVGRADLTTGDHDASVTEAQDLHEDTMTFEPNARSLQNSSNQGCSLSGTISCIVLSDNSDCEDIVVRKDLCQTVPIVMKYTYCNEEVLSFNKIVIFPSNTYANLYGINRIRLDSSDLQPGQCRSIYQSGEVDTCTRSRVNAEMKVEGWKQYINNYGSYCNLYKHYFPRLIKYTKSPTSAPIYLYPNFTLVLRCYLETTRGGKMFSVPCDQLSSDYFFKSAQPQEGFDYKRNIKYQFMVINHGNEVIQMNDISVLLGDERNTVFGDRVLIQANSRRVVASFIKLVDFYTYSEQVFSLFAETSAIGAISGNEVKKVEIDSFPVP